MTKYSNHYITSVLQFYFIFFFCSIAQTNVRFIYDKLEWKWLKKNEQNFECGTLVWRLWNSMESAENSLTNYRFLWIKYTIHLSISSLMNRLLLIAEHEGDKTKCENIRKHFYNPVVISILFFAVAFRSKQANE